MQIPIKKFYLTEVFLPVKINSFRSDGKDLYPILDISIAGYIIEKHFQ